MEEKVDIITKLGQFTGETATIDECHSNGYWHRAVYAFIIDKDLNVLLQKRSSDKKLWPNKWDVSVGGHVLAGELGRQAIIRECKEELGIDVLDNEIKYLISSTSVYANKGYVNNHYDECFLIKKEIDMSNIKLQKNEVSDVKLFTIKGIVSMITNDYNDLTEKTVSWSFFKYFADNNLLN